MYSIPLYDLRRLPLTGLGWAGDFRRPWVLGSSEIGAVALPSPQPSPTGEGVDVGMSRMLWAGSKVNVSLRPVWLLRAS